MTSVLRRYFADHRPLLTTLLAVAGGNLLFQLVVLGPLARKLERVRGDHQSRQAEMTAAFKEYAGALLEAEVLESARARIEGLRTDVLQLKPARFPVVDAMVKELQDRFGGTSQTMTYSYSEMPGEQLEKFTVIFQLKGSYQTLREFVSAVEQAADTAGNDLFFALESISLEDSTLTGRELNLTVRLVTYFYSPEIGQALRGPIEPERVEASRKRRSTTTARRAGRR